MMASIQGSWASTAVSGNPWLENWVRMPETLGCSWVTGHRPLGSGCTDSLRPVTWENRAGETTPGCNLG